MSPTTSLRSASAACVTAAKSGPRASNSRTMSPSERSSPRTARSRIGARLALGRTDGVGQRRDVVGRHRHDEARPPVVVAPQAARRAHRQHARAQRRIDPGLVVDVARIDREPLGQHLAVARALGRERVELRPRPLGIHVVGRDRRDAAPVVDAGLDQAAVARLLQVGRRLDRQRVAEDQARDGDGPQQLVERRLGRIGHARVGLGLEVLDDDFLQMAVRAMQVAQRQQRLDPLLARLADADQDARGERHLRLAGGLRASRAAAPAPCRARRSAARRARPAARPCVSSMMPIDTDDLRSFARSAASIRPGLKCGSRPVSLKTSAPIAAR